MFRIVLIISIFLYSCAQEEKRSSLPYYNTPDFTPLFLNHEEALTKVKHTIQGLEVIDQSGLQLTRESLKGKIHVANFFFASCGIICPKMMNHLKKVVESFKADSGVVFMSYSVTPWSDSLPVLKAYAASNDFQYANWHLCTGETGPIYKLARQSYFAEESLGYTKDSTEFLHTEHVVLVDSSLRIRGIYNGTLQLDMQQLEADIRELKKQLY